MSQHAAHCSGLKVVLFNIKVTNHLSHACIHQFGSVAERAVVVCARCCLLPVAGVALLLSLLLSSAALSAAAEVGKEQKSGDPARTNTQAQDAAPLDNKSVKPNSGNSSSSDSSSTGSSSSSINKGDGTTSSSKDSTLPAKPGQVVRPKAPGMNDVGPDGKYRFPLDLKLSVKREGLKAVGTATITNTLKDTVEVGVGPDCCFSFPVYTLVPLGSHYLSAARPTARGSWVCLQVNQSELVVVMSVDAPDPHRASAWHPPLYTHATCLYVQYMEWGAPLCFVCLRRSPRSTLTYASLTQQQSLTKVCASQPAALLHQHRTSWSHSCRCVTCPGQLLWSTFRLDCQ